MLLVFHVIFAVWSLANSFYFGMQSPFESSVTNESSMFLQNIEDSFEAKKKAGVVFVDLTDAYDTAWHRGLTCKLLRLLPDKHIIRMIMELVQNRSFTLTIGDSKQSRLRHLRNGLIFRLGG